jgi:hypothetical protein
MVEAIELCSDRHESEVKLKGGRKGERDIERERERHHPLIIIILLLYEGE